MTPTETKLGSPQLFVVCICASNAVSTELVQADSWQAAILRQLAVYSPETLECNDFIPMLTDEAKFRLLYPTIRSMKSALWATSLLSMSIGIIRPAVAAINTNYEKSEDGPLSATTVKVAVEHMSLYDDVVYVP